MLRSTVLLLTGIVISSADLGPVMAQERRLPFEHTIAFGLEQLASPDRCGGPYGFYRLTCVHNELNVSHSRSARTYHTILDRLALAIDRYKDLHLNSDLGPGASFKLKAQLATLYRKEAEVRFTVKLRF